MENQISYLKNENNVNKWKGIKKMLSDKHEEYKKRIPEPENNDISIDINFGCGCKKYDNSTSNRLW